MSALQLRVKYGNTSHRWVKQTKVTLSGAIERKNNVGSGDHIFEVNPGNVDLTIEIPPQGGLANSIYLIQQSLNILSAPPFIHSVGKPYDERLMVTTQSSKRGHFIEIKVDNNFIDVTAYARKVKFTKPPPPRKPGSPPKPPPPPTPILQPYDDMTPTPLPPSPGPSSGPAPPPPPSHWGNKLVLLEYTAGEAGAPVWMVFIPPKLQGEIIRAQAHNCLFFRPEDFQYKNTDDVQPNIERALRYLQDPPASDPFDVSDETPYRDCGFERQIALANRPALFIYPIPLGAAFGDASTKIDLVDSVQALLIATGLISVIDRDSGLRSPHKLAVAGYSHGGDAVFQLLSRTKHQAKIDELYLFDPNAFAENMSTLVSWMELGNKRLRMIAGAFRQDKMIELDAKLKKHTDLKGSEWSLKQGDPGYWQSDALYQAARSGIPAAAMRLEDASGTTAPTTTTGSLSDQTGIFVVPASNAGAGMTFRWFPPTKQAVDRTLGRCSNGEASGVIAKLLGPIKKVTTAAEFDVAIKRIEFFFDGDHDKHRIGELRHDWTVVGGEDAASATDRGSTFKGFLHLCLEASGFD